MFLPHCFRRPRRAPRGGWPPTVVESLEERALLAAFTPGNIVVSNAPLTGGEPRLFEYDTAGNRVQEFDIPPNAAGEIARDVLVDFNGNAQIYNGTFQPELATLDPTIGTVTENRTFANWSTANNLTYGGVAAYGHYVFATDTKTGDDAESDVGIVRFDINGTQAERFGSSEGRMIDVTVGLDGLVYALGPSGSPFGTSVSVYDPESLQLIRQIAMQHQNRALAVNADGTIFTVGGIEGIRRYDANGQQVGETLSDNGIGGLADIDLNSNGDILIASHGGVVAFTTEALDSLTSFNTRTSNGYNFAGWVPLPSQVTIDVVDATIPESGGSTTATIRRNTNTEQDLLVTLNSMPADTLSFPTTVVIPAGQSTATITLTALDDDLALGTQAVTIHASADAHATGQFTVFVTDDDTPELHITAAESSLSENGGSTTIRVHRNSDTQAPLQVALLSLDGTELQTPQSVTIPAGSRLSAPVVVAGIDDQVVDGSQSVAIQATADGHETGLLSVTVTDDDVPTLHLQLSATTLAENGGTTSGFVRRNTPSTTPLTVEVRVSAPQRLLAPAFVTIPAGADAAAFTLTSIDDSLVNDSSGVTVTVAATDFESATAQATITDDDTAAVSFVLGDTTVTEGSELIGRIHRNSSLSEPLLVTLFSSDPAQLSVPASVVISAGERLSPEFSVLAEEDLLVEDTQPFRVSAFAADHVSGTDDIDVIDNDVATLQVELTGRLLSESGGVTQLIVHRNADLDQPLTVTLSSGDITEVSIPASVTIPAGDVSSAPVEVRAVADGRVDGDQTVVLTAAATGFLSGSDEAFVLDVDVPQLTTTASATTLSEDGGQVTISVARNTPTEEPLEVSLMVSIAGVVSLPATLTIPAETSQANLLVTGLDNENVAGDLDISVSVSSDGFVTGSVVLTVEDDDELSGDVDEDVDFDANDSFLMHLVALAGSDQQIDQSKGPTSLPAAEIRERITALLRHGDVDGDGDFDANDTFLIHLVNLSGSNSQLDQSKGVSPLTAAQIRENVNRLGRRAGGSTESWEAAPPTVKSAFSAPTDPPPPSRLSEPPQTPIHDALLWPVWSRYRHWIDRL